MYRLKSKIKKSFKLDFSNYPYCEPLVYSLGFKVNRITARELHKNDF